MRIVVVDLILGYGAASSNSVATYFISTLGYCQPINTTTKQLSAHSIFTLASPHSHMHRVALSVLTLRFLAVDASFLFFSHCSHFLCLSQIFGTNYKNHLPRRHRTYLLFYFSYIAVGLNVLTTYTPNG